MGILIAAVVIAVCAGISLVVLACKLGSRGTGVADRTRTGRQHGRYVGGGCPCGGQLQYMWQHGRGQVLGCSNYPDCAKAYQFNGRPLPPVAIRILQRTS
jgi:hypothetical protein